MTFITVRTEVEVEVDLAEIDTEDLASELELRRLRGTQEAPADTDDLTTVARHLIERLHHAVRMHRDDERDEAIRHIVDQGIGRIL